MNSLLVGIGSFKGLAGVAIAAVASMLFIQVGGQSWLRVLAAVGGMAGCILTATAAEARFGKVLFFGISAVWAVLAILFL